MKQVVSRRTIARATTYMVVALLAFWALHLNPPIAPKAGEVLTTAARTPSVALAPLVRTTVDTLERGETLRSVLARGGVSDLVIGEALSAAKMLDLRRVPAGMPVMVRSAAHDSVPTEITLQLAIDYLVHLKRTGDRWVGTEEHLPWTTDTVAVAGVVNSTLYETLDSSAASVLPARQSRAELAWTLADIYEYRIDMSRDLQPGDSVRMVFERKVGPGGVTKVGNILAASVESGGEAVDAVRFVHKDGGAEYFDRDGRSLRAAFLRAPLAFRRISSVFGQRHHPILGVTRAHKGIDYAASAGTPVRAIGDGVVVSASWSNGYGNLLQIRHRNGFVTRYGHMRAFAKGIHAGTRVSIGQTVGYVGSTGLSTGPHLHFEVLVGGVQRDPRVALKLKGGLPLAASERSAFNAQRDRMLAILDAPTGPVRLAAR